MSERLKVLMKVADPYYSSDSPLLLEAFALYQDTETERNVAQLKWANLGTKKITAVMVDLNCFDAFNQKKETVSYQYTDVNANQNDEFGSKTAIQIKSSVVTRYEVLLKGIAFENGEIWKPTQIEAFTPLPAKNPQELTGELLQQYKRDLAEANIPAEASVYMPRKHSGLWQCGCGNWQLEGDECCLCHCTYEQLQSMYSTDTLLEHLAKYNEDLRIAKEKKQEEDRLQAIARAKSDKNAKRVIICVILAFAIGMVLFNWVIPSVRYNKAVQLMSANQLDKAYAIFTQLGDFKDSQIQITEIKYINANALLEQGNYDEAYTLFFSIKDYKDVEKMLSTNSNLREAAAAAAKAIDAAYRPGKYVNFGHYPQTSAGNDNTAIEWLVLARDGQKALLLSHYGLDSRSYTTNQSSMAWEYCPLRKWLNREFLNNAFSAQERSIILLTNVDNSKSQAYSSHRLAPDGNDTEDKVFLLSYVEANKYLDVTYKDSNNIKSRVAPTDYAIKHGAGVWSFYETASGKATGYWYLRHPNGQADAVPCVGYDGTYRSFTIDSTGASVRPALWVNLDAMIPQQ